jgi:hypothetical protein
MRSTGRCGCLRKRCCLPSSGRRQQPRVSILCLPGDGRRSVGATPLYLGSTPRAARGAARDPSGVDRFSFFSRSRSKNALGPARPLGSDNGDTGPGAHRVPGCSGAFRTSGRRHDNNNHRSAYTPPWLQHSFLPDVVADPVHVCRRQQGCQNNKAISQPEVGNGPSAQRVW